MFAQRHLLFVAICFLSVQIFYAHPSDDWYRNGIAGLTIAGTNSRQSHQHTADPTGLPAGLEAARKMLPQHRNDQRSYQSQYTDRQLAFFTDIKNNIHNMTYQEVTHKYHNDFKDPMIKKYYDYLTNHLFNQKNIQKLVSRDPLWREATRKQKKNSEFRSQMLMRLHYQYELEQNIGFENFSSAARDLLYDLVEELSNVNDRPEICEEEMYFSFIHKVSVEIDQYPAEVKQFYCHESGVLKTFTDHPYIQQHFLHHKIISPNLRHSINYAASITHTDLFLSCEILHAAREALESIDPHYQNFYEQRAIDLYHECNPADYKSFAPPLTQAYIQKFHQLEIDPTLDQRVIAYEQARQNNFAEREVQYRFSSQVKGFMMSQGMNPVLFSRMKGNELQHHIIQELFDIMEHSADQQHPLTSELATFVDLAQNYNCAKSLDNAMTSADICWNIFEYGKAIVMGCYDTADGVAELIVHPVDSLISCGKNLGKLAATLGEGFVETCKYGHDFFYDPASARLAEQQFMDGLFDLNDRFQATSGPDRVRFATHMITDFFCTGKALGAIGKIALVGGKKAYDFSKLTALELFELSRKEKVFAQTVMGDMAVAFFEGGEHVAEYNQLANKSVKSLKDPRNFADASKSFHNPNAKRKIIDQQLGSMQKRFSKHGNVAHNVNAREALIHKLDKLAKLETEAVQIKILPDGRIRYYEIEKLANKLGKTRGSAMVWEHNPKTGQLRSWYESRDHFGKVNRIHTKTISGHNVQGQHYPPTGKEL